MISITWIALHADEELEARANAALSPEERDKALRFATPVLQSRYRLAHAALRYVLACSIRAEMRQVRLISRPDGKPAVSPAGEAGAIEFSLSHSEDVACIATSGDGPIGLDFEQLRPVPDADEILAGILSPAEGAILLPLIADGALDPNSALLRCWTLKESVLKACGLGLRIEPAKVSLDPSMLAANLLHHRTSPIDAWLPDIAGQTARSGSRWTTHPFSLKQGFGAASTCASTGISHGIELRELTTMELRTGLERDSRTPTFA